tara:strand:+ start:1388 stop:2062 length:675 start_codon:yes stop_codon:yes gene_type:complete
MALRLLPFRQYNEHDVVNLFALDKTLTDAIDADQILKGDNGVNDNGVLVKVKTADMTGTNGNPWEPVKYDTNSYLGKTDYPHIGSNEYPFAQLTFEPTAGTATTEEILGVALNQTLTHDENGEKLLYYRQKALELQSVLPGEVVPVLTRGIITLAQVAFDVVPTQGAAVYAAADGKFTSDAAGGGARIGKCLAVGGREPFGNDDYFAGAPGGATGGYYIIKLEL